MKLTIYPQAVVRIPKISFEKDLKSSWETLKAMIMDASPEFYSIIEKLDYPDIAKADRRIQQTIWKYFNRARFRATPFGEFASTGCVAIQNQKVVKPILYRGQVVHEFEDWSVYDETASRLQLETASLTCNSTYYIVGQEIRYLRKQDQEFEIATVEYDPLIIDILSFATIEKSYSDLYAFVKIRLSDTGQINGLLQELHDQQLLLSSLNANIIGTDFFQRHAPEKPNDAPQYKIAESELVQQPYDIKVFSHLPAADMLSKLSGPGAPEDLKAFAERFFKKFEQANIPLMMALDPEIGVGYAFTEQQAGTKNDQIARLRSIETSAEPPQTRTTQRFLSLFSEPVFKKVVNIEDFIPDAEPKSHIANSVSAICTVADGMVWLEYLGGATANALIGRFTPAVAGTKEICKEITEIENNANPDVIFFDIGYINEVKVDNINRRQQIYDAQVNILNYDPNNISLPISDIMMCVKNERVILYSNKLKKRLIPRMASAYNYKRSTLPLFRMLCDLMFQDVRADLMLRPGTLFSEQNFYPRLIYKNIVLSPATWRLEWKTLRDAPIKMLKIGIGKRDIPRYVRAGLGDQTLLFDTQNPDELNILADTIRKEGQLLITEAPLPDKNIVLDQSNNSYFAQFIISLVHSKAVIAPFAPVIDNGEEFKLWLSPGKQWLYFEIYLSHFRADEILVTKITPFLKNNKSKIASWFFIRYHEGGEHIRLRLKLNSTADSSVLIERLSQTLDLEFGAGIISDLKICTYKKEVHRYGKENMERVEKHFCFDSEYVFTMLAEGWSDIQKYNHCLKMLLLFQENKIMDLTDFESMVEKIVKALSNEHKVNPEKYRLLNSMYNQLNGPDKMMHEENKLGSYDALVDSFFYTVSHCKKESRKILLADLMHMHINRMFDTDQRSHELVIFYFFQKELKKRKFQAQAMIRS